MRFQQKVTRLCWAKRNHMDLLLENYLLHQLLLRLHYDDLPKSRHHRWLCHFIHKLKNLEKVQVPYKQNQSLDQGKFKSVR